MRHGGCAGQRQASDHCEYRSEGHGRDEAEEHIAANRPGKVDGRHVGAAQ
jgi:hypothetical protein